MKKALIAVSGLACALALALTACHKKSSSSSSTVLSGGNVSVSMASNSGGAGKVTSSPSGINCTESGSGVSGTCSFSFPVNTPVTLTAAPNSGDTLGGFNGGINYNCNGSNCTTPPNLGSSSCSGASCTVTLLLSTVTASFSAAFDGSSTNSGSIAGLAADLAGGGNEICQAVMAVDPGAVSSCGGGSCQSGSVSYGSFSNNGSSASQNPVTINGSMTETFSGCALQQGGSTTTLTLNGTVNITFSNASLNFSPSNDYNNTNWTSIAITGSESLSASSLSVTPQGASSATSCSVSESVGLNQTATSSHSGTNTNTYTGSSGCVAGQSGTE